MISRQTLANLLMRYEMKYSLRILPDPDPPNPRDDDNLGTMICFHNRYNLGDKTKLTSDNFKSWKELEDYLIKKEGAAVILPIYIYDHSGITISTQPFSCPWDSGQIGFIYVSREKLLDEYNKKYVTHALKVKAAGILRDEVDAYDVYLQGDYWGYEIVDENDNPVDSCWGYDDYNYCKKEGQAALQGLL